MKEWAHRIKAVGPLMLAGEIVLSFEQKEELRILRALDIQRSRTSFLHYYQRMTGFTPELHHSKICRLIQAMDDDKIDRAMISLPPRMAKSTICTMLAPSWLLGKYPLTNVMSGVHTQKFAEKIGKNVRNYLRSPLYPFETQLAKDSQAKSQWSTSLGGEYNGFGLMGGSTHGNPAEWLFMDDLIKGRKMALSAHMREEAWETYKADLLTRLQGRRKQLMIGTRWNEDDVAGRILPEDYNGESGWIKDRETGELWYVLNIPAKAESDNDPLGRKVGEWLWPEQWGEKAWGAVERRGGYIWSALYQGRPAPVDGLLFASEHINYYDIADIDLNALQIYITSDYAVTDEAGAPDPDYTVHTVWGIDHNWNIYMLDMWRGRTLSNVWADEFIKLVRKWKPLMAGEEDGQIIKGVGPFLSLALRKENVFIHRKRYTSSTSKEQRAASILGMAAEGKLHLLRGHQYTELFRAELLAFPGGKHDDMVDTATLLGRMLAEIISGTKGNAGLPHTETLDELFLRHEKDH